LDRASNIQQDRVPIHRVAERENVAFANKRNQQQSKSLLEQAASVIGSLISSNSGHCIRCGEGIELNPSKPLCSHCYEKWRQYGNPGFVENFCHNCGEPYETSLARPLCRSCYKS
jgi:RNA polymerase-binding transcription factor DksA